MPAQELVLAAGYGVGLPTASAASASYKPSANRFAGLQTVTDCDRLSQLAGFVVERRGLCRQCGDRLSVRHVREFSRNE